MPAKRVILLDRAGGPMWFRYVLWADVPAGNQIAYRNPSATSRYDNATPTELQAIRDGLVAEKSGEYQTDSTSLPAIQTYLEARWNEWQSEVSTSAAWSEYGRFWNGTSWTAGAGVPMASAKVGQEGLPAFTAITPVSAYGANKFHFVLFNGVSSTVGQPFAVKVRLLAVLPGLATVTGAAPSAWSLQRRIGPSTNPAGGAVAPVSHDSAMVLPTGVTAHNAPTTAPAGGTLGVFRSFVPQADEYKLSTADAPTLSAALSEVGGQVIYNADQTCKATPLTIRAGETLEVQQSATAGTGNCQILCTFTVG